MKYDIASRLSNRLKEMIFRESFRLNLDGGSVLDTGIRESCGLLVTNDGREFLE